MSDAQHGFKLLEFGSLEADQEKVYIHAKRNWYASHGDVMIPWTQPEDPRSWDRKEGQCLNIYPQCEAACRSKA